MKEFIAKLFGLRKDDALRDMRILNLEPSYLCNLKCLMCQRNVRDHKKGLMSLDCFKQMEPYLSRFTHVVLTGAGEPLFNKDLPEMVRRVRAQGALPCLTTNATMLTQEFAHMLLSAGIDHLTVSIDAGTKETYEHIRVGATWEMVLENAKQFNELRKTLPGNLCPSGTMWAFVLMRDNFRELPMAVSKAAECGFSAVLTNFISINMVDYEKTQMLHSDDGNLLPDVKDEFEAVMKEAKAEADRVGVALTPMSYFMENTGYGCQFAIKDIFIDWMGNVTPCCLRPVHDEDAERSADHLCGNIMTQSFEDILRGRRYRAYRQAWLSHTLPATCRTCYMRHRIHPSFYQAGNSNGSSCCSCCKE